ncbi:MAG: hypothetical protein JST44_04265 [Cyanobacteria bacterium SZAS LIN-5]|nr:hypothetical protein [Cyanobacteria bacterium SZAS LIN-5]
MIEQELQPKTELERAFVQARSWEPMHSWRRGTSDLRSGRLSAATGIYLALVRSYALIGQTEECETTLKCLDQYLSSFTATDILSAIRVLCSIMVELQDETEESFKRELLQKCLTKSAVAFTAQIKENKLAVTDALSLIKKSSDLDVISDHLNSQKLAKLSEAMEAFKSKNRMPVEACNSETETESESDSEPDLESMAELEAIFKAAQFEHSHVDSVRILSDFAVTLLDERKILQAKIVCQHVLKSLTDYSQTGTSSSDAIMMELLSALGYKLFVRDLKEEACEFFFEAVCASIRARRFEKSTNEEIMEMAIQGLTSKQYALWAAKLEDVLKLLALQADESDAFAITHSQTTLHHRLLSTLANGDEKLDLQCIASMNTLVELCRNSIGSPFFINILPYIAELLQARINKQYVPGVLDVLWNGAFNSPLVKIYNHYIQPLLIITEQQLGSSTPKSYKYYSHIFEELKKSGLESQQLIVFWRILIGLRESVDGHNSPSLLPLLSALASQYARVNAVRDALDIIERVQLMNLSDLSGINCGASTIPSYVEALVNLTAIDLRMPHVNRGRLVFYDEIKKIVKANAPHERVAEEIRLVLCEAISKFSKPNNFWAHSKLLPALDTILAEQQSQK